MAQKKDEGLLTLTAFAKKVGVSPDVVKKAVAEAQIEPAKVRCGCSYYSVEDLAKIEEKLKK